MGKINQGILGGFNGKVGTVIGSSWKGKSVMRARAQSVKDPKTPAQMVQRAYFARLVSLAQQLTDDQLKSLFPSSVKGKTRRNLLVIQLDACASVSGGIKSVDLTLIEGIGNGERINVPMLSASPSSVGDVPTLSVAAANLAQVNKPTNANFIVVAYNVTQGKIMLFNTSHTSTSTNLSLPVSGFADTTDTIRFYLTYAQSGENVSDKGFGSFIIKTRKPKQGRNNQAN